MSARRWLPEVPRGWPDLTRETTEPYFRRLDDALAGFPEPVFPDRGRIFRALELTPRDRVRVVILRMSHVTTLDATGAHVLADTIGRLERRGITVLLSGVRPQHTRVLEELGVHERLAHERHLFPTTPDAIAHARLHAARVSHDPPPAPTY